MMRLPFLSLNTFFSTEMIDIKFIATYGKKLPVGS
jgi:hypothetical protein